MFDMWTKFMPLINTGHNKSHQIIDYEKKIIFVIFIMIYIYHIVKNAKIIYVCFVKKSMIIIIQKLNIKI